MIPKVSVIVPCHEYAAHIEQCLMSVMLQRVDFAIEIIVGDDCSSDASYDVAARFASDYKRPGVEFAVYRNEENLGEIMNTKKLLDMARGEYVAYIDADDYWINPNKLRLQAGVLDDDSLCSACITGYLEQHGGMFYPSLDGKTFFCPIDMSDVESESLVSGNSWGSSSSRMFRNYRKNGASSLFCEYFFEFPFSDWPINFELSLRGKLRFLNFAGYAYRRHALSLSSTLPEKESGKDWLYWHRTEILSKRLSAYRAGLI